MIERSIEGRKNRARERERERPEIERGRERGERSTRREGERGEVRVEDHVTPTFICDLSVWVRYCETL